LFVCLRFILAIDGCVIIIVSCLCGISKNKCDGMKEMSRKSAAGQVLFKLMYHGDEVFVALSKKHLHLNYAQQEKIFDF
jgi:hypothetical protein